MASYYDENAPIEQQIRQVQAIINNPGKNFVAADAQNALATLQARQGALSENSGTTKEIQAAQKENGGTPSSAALDPYGTSGIANQAVRRRGSTDQSRVTVDTRMRNDANSGTAGATSGIGNAMEQASTPETQQTPVAAAGKVTTELPQSNMWQATRQPTNLAAVQQRVLQSLMKPNGGQ